MRLHLIALAVTAALLAPPAVRAQDKSPYDINVVLGLTGSGSFIAEGQSAALHAVEKYVNDGGGIKGRPIRFVLADSQSKPQVDVQLTTGILTKNPPFVIDGGPGAACKAASTLYAKGPVMYCLSPGFHPDRGSWAYGAGIESGVGMGVVVKYLRMKGYKKLGVITMTDIAGQEADSALKAELAEPLNAGLQVVDWEHFAPTDISATAQMTKIKEAKPDVVLGWATGTPTGTLLLAYTDAGMTIPFVASQANENARQMQQYKATMPRDLMMYSVMFPAAPTLARGPLKTAIDTYVRMMTATGAQLGDASSSETWDAAMILIGALRSVGTSATAEQVRGYIAGLHGYNGPTGTFDFRLGNQRGIDANSAIMVRWDAANASWKPLSGPTGTPL